MTGRREVLVKRPGGNREGEPRGRSHQPRVVWSEATRLTGPGWALHCRRTHAERDAGDADDGLRGR